MTNFAKENENFTQFTKTYDIDDFVEESKNILKDYICHFCKGIYDDPQLASCGHIFCKICLRKHFETQKKCPLDDLTISSDHIFNVVFLSNLLEKHKLNCKNRLKGCDWQGNMSEMKNHLSNICEYRCLRCENEGCDFIAEKSVIINHRKECPFREFICEYCNRNFKINMLEKHEEDCEEKIVDCENGCGINIRRKNMNNHIKINCEESLILCSYYHLGCEEKIKKKNLQEHLTNGVLFHMDLLNKEIIRLKNRGENQTSKLKNKEKSPEEEINIMEYDKNAENVIQNEKSFDKNVHKISSLSHPISKKFEKCPENFIDEKKQKESKEKNNLKAIILNKNLPPTSPKEKQTEIGKFFNLNSSNILKSPNVSNSNQEGINRSLSNSKLISNIQQYNQFNMQSLKKLNFQIDTEKDKISQNLPEKTKEGLHQINLDDSDEDLNNRNILDLDFDSEKKNYIKSKEEKKVSSLKSSKGKTSFKDFDFNNNETKEEKQRRRGRPRKNKEEDLSNEKVEERNFINSNKSDEEGEKLFKVNLLLNVESKEYSEEEKFKKKDDVINNKQNNIEDECEEINFNNLFQNLIKEEENKKDKKYDQLLNKKRKLRKNKNILTEEEALETKMNTFPENANKTNENLQSSNELEEVVNNKLDLKQKNSSQKKLYDCVIEENLFDHVIISKDLEIIKNTVTDRSDSNSNPSHKFAFLNLHLNEKNASWTVETKINSNWISLGVCLKELVIKNNYRFTNGISCDDSLKSFFGISSNGYIWNRNNPLENNKKVEHLTFNSVQKVKFSYDIMTMTLTFSLNDQTQILNGVFSDEDMQLVPCVVFVRNGDSATFYKN